MSDTTELSPPIVPFLKRDGETPYLSGSKCRSCGHVYVGARAVCANCTARNQMDEIRLAETGKVYVFTIIYRSFPGVETPFVDAIIDLDDGAHIKGTLINVEPDPEKIPPDLRVRVVYREAAPVNKPGVPHLTYAFEPIN